MSDDRLIPTSQPADRPSFKILSEGQQVSGEYQVQGVVVSREFNRVASCDLLILDGDPAAQDFEISAASDFEPGKKIEIQAGYHGDEESLFQGIVVRHGISVRKEKPSYLRVQCRDVAVKLTVGRKSAYFYDVKDSELIEEIAGSAGLDAEVEATSVKHAQMVQFYATDWDFLLARAESNGKLVVTESGKLVVKAPDGGKEPVLSLSYGKNLLDFEAVMDARDQFSAAKAFAWDASNQEMLEIEGASPSAVSPGNASPDDLAKVIDIEALELKHAGQLKDDELQAWADAQRLKSAFAKVRGRVRIQGFGAVGPGDVIELGGVGDRFNGKALVSGVRHEIDAENWETDISFGLSPEWFAQTRREVVEAPANGLLPGAPGLQLGLVTALEGDPDGEDRVQVRIPLIDPAEEGVWARIATLDAGEKRGTFFRPEVGDEVVLGFLNDDPRNPVVLGMLNSSAKPAPLAASDDNHEKGLVTRSEMKLLFNDDKKTITIETPNGNKVLISDEDGGMTLEDENGNKLVMDSSGITLESASDFTIKASGDVTVEGANVSTAASAQLKVEGSGGAELSSGGSTVVKGSVVQIN
jgi:Rhs element Vgr protein